MGIQALFQSQRRKGGRYLLPFVGLAWGHAGWSELSIRADPSSISLAVQFAGVSLPGVGPSSVQLYYSNNQPGRYQLMVTRPRDLFPGPIQVQAKILALQSVPLTQSGQARGLCSLNPVQTAVLISDIGQCSAIAQVLCLGVVPLTTRPTSFSTQLTFTLLGAGS